MNTHKGNSYLVLIIGVLIFLLTMVLFEDNILGLIFFATPVVVIMVYQAIKISQENITPASYYQEKGYEYKRREEGILQIIIHNTPQQNPYLTPGTKPYTGDTTRLEEVNPNYIPPELKDYIRAYVKRQLDEMQGV